MTRTFHASSKTLLDKSCMPRNSPLSSNGQVAARLPQHNYSQVHLKSFQASQTIIVLVLREHELSNYKKIELVQKHRRILHIWSFDSSEIISILDNDERHDATESAQCTGDTIIDEYSWNVSFSIMGSNSLCFLDRDFFISNTNSWESEFGAFSLETDYNLTSDRLLSVTGTYSYWETGPDCTPPWKETPRTPRRIEELILTSN